MSTIADRKLRRWHGQEQTATLGQDKMRKLIKWMVYSLEIFMWSQDTACYDGDIFDKVEELYLELLEYFEPDTDEFGEYDVE